MWTRAKLEPGEIGSPHFDKYFALISLRFAAPVPKRRGFCRL